ncbi:hypothetical protein BD311DRAFT_803957 [Dichomitus squalens]|uniref:Uncharacterized protein n=1 Tax=Dichomitus squalens TaxID=114155 RepID=A0A4Q9MY87_9APHY|nr:hypothetical protein BD311DRAFT_803957 [Dichomitus squalens]
MDELVGVVAEVKAKPPSLSPVEAPAVHLPPAAVPASSLPPSVAPAPTSPAAKSASTVASLSSKPEPEIDKKASNARRRSRSPPIGPRHYHVSTPSHKSPAQNTHGGPNLPSKPDWVRRNAGREAVKQEATTSAPAPAAPTAPSEPAASVPVIPPYQPKPSITADIEAEIARVRAHRAHIENEYIQIAKDTRRALSDLMIADIDLKNAEARRAVSSAQLEKARLGKLGIDFIAGA